MERYLKRLKHDPDNAQLHYSLGVVYSKTNRPEEALTEYQTTVLLNPNHKNALFNMAWVYAARQDWPQAAEYYERVVNLPMENREIDRQAYEYLSMVYKNMGQDQKVQWSLERMKHLEESLKKND